MAEILFAEDEAVLGKLVKEAMEGKGHKVHWATNGIDALRLFKDGNIDVCVLDVMMPGMDGFVLAQQIRSMAASVPILFLTARSQTADVIKGFQSGGNDYLRKPFSLDELFLRINELIKRNQPAAKDVNKEELPIGKYTFYPLLQTLVFEGEKTKLSHKESELLKELIINRNELVDRKLVLIKLWGDDNIFNARNMDVYITKLRKHLSADPAVSIINIRGFGFKLIYDPS